jgi:hypothetical protein
MVPSSFVSRRLARGTQGMVFFCQQLSSLSLHSLSRPHLTLELFKVPLVLVDLADQGGACLDVSSCSLRSLNSKRCIAAGAF